MDCRVRIELESAEARFESRAPIRGRVVAEVERACICDPLTLTLETTTTGRGHGGSSDLVVKSLATGAWEAGEHAVPFELPAPAFPPSYRGSQFSRSYALRADLAVWDSGGAAAIGHARDSVPFELSLPEDPGLAVTGERRGSPDQVDQRSASGPIGAGLFFAGAAVLTGYGAVAVHVPVLIAGVVAVVVTGALLALAIQVYRAEGILGAPQLAISADAGDGYRTSAAPAHRATVWVKPSAPVTRVELHTEVFEQTVTGSRSMENYNVATTALWSGATVLSREADGVWTGDLALPPPGQQPYSADHGWGNSVRWEARAVIDFGDTEPGGVTVPLRARPARGPGAG